jgi:hypothetical protein
MKTFGATLLAAFGVAFGRAVALAGFAGRGTGES